MRGRFGSFIAYRDPWVYNGAPPARGRRRGHCRLTHEQGGSPPLHLAHVVAMDIGVLPCPHVGGGAPRRGDLVKAGAVVAVCHPDGLAVGEAGGGRETHGVGW